MLKCVSVTWWTTLLTRPNLAPLACRNPCCVGAPQNRLSILSAAFIGRVVGPIAMPTLCFLVQVR